MWCSCCAALLVLLVQHLCETHVCLAGCVLTLLPLQPAQEAEESEDADMSGEGSSSDVEDGSDEEDNPRRRLSTWRPVRLDSAAGAAAARARAPQLHMLANPAPDTSCLQLDSGLCATGDSGADGQVHLWSTEDDELDFKCSLAGHPHGVATLSFQVRRPSAA